jgi:hypothetical protein
MALGLAAGFQYLGLMSRINALFADVFSPQAIGKAELSLNPWILWLGTALLAFALPAVILNIPGAWRRIVVWAGAFLLTLSWAPVLLLAAHKPEIAAALIAVVWSGFCAMFYTTNHAMPVDRVAAQRGKENNGAR